MDDVYSDAVDDPSTLTVTVNGRKIPAVIDMKHGIGMDYNEDRARHILGDAKPISVLSVPIGDLSERDAAATFDVVASGGSRFLYMGDNSGQDGKRLQEGLANRGVDVVEHPLLDSHAPEGSQQASLSTWQVDVQYQNGEGTLRSLGDVLQHFTANTLPTVPDSRNATLLRGGDSFSDDELTEIWDLYRNSLRDLGENHPIFLEDRESDFLEMLTDPNMLVSIKYVDGIPICFTYLTEDIHGLYRMNGPTVDAIENSASPSQMVIYFPGLVADRRYGGMNSFEVIKTFADECAKINAEARVTFEATNVSSQYVPKIVYRTLSGNPVFDVTRPYHIDETTYRLFEITSNDM
jgi:hypothetical protein